MTWNAAEQRWHKRYLGKAYAVSPRQLGCDRSKQASRDAANHWWELKQAEVDAASFANSDAGLAVAAARRSADKSLEQAKSLNDADRYTLWQPIVRALQQRVENQEALPEQFSADPEGGLAVDGLPPLPALPPAELRLLIDELFRTALARAAGTSPAEPWKQQLQQNGKARTIKAAIEEFLAAKRSKRPPLSPERISSLFRELSRMGEVLCASDPERLTSTIDESAIRQLLSFRGNWCANWSAKTYQHYYRSIGQFIRWSERQDYIGRLPKNLPDLTVTVLPPGEQPTFSADEIRDLLSKLDTLADDFDLDWLTRVAANAKRCPSLRRNMKPRRNSARFLKLCFLLMLNTGGTQQDCSASHEVAQMAS